MRGGRTETSYYDDLGKSLPRFRAQVSPWLAERLGPAGV